MATLTCERFGKAFASPLVLASGPAGFGVELSAALDASSVGAITTKTITPEPRSGNAQPRLVDCPAGAINSIGLENPGIESFVRNDHPAIERLPIPRLLSLAAASASQMSALVRRVGDLDGYEAIELNLSCPNIGGAITGADAGAVGEFTRAAAGESALPVLVKLPGDTGNLLESCEAALRQGAAGLTLINSLRGLRIDWSTGVPCLSRIYGGLSGPAIFPIALARVYEVRCAFPETVIIGTGGVSDLGSLLEMLLAGADFVGLGFGMMVDPQLPEKLCGKLETWLDDRSFKSVQEIMGLAHSGGFNVH